MTSPKCIVSFKVSLAIQLSVRVSWPDDIVKFIKTVLDNNANKRLGRGPSSLHHIRTLPTVTRNS